MTKDSKAPKKKDFATLFATLAGGDVNDKATEQLAELVDAIERTGASGTLTIVLKVKKDNKMVLVIPELKLKKPAEPIDQTMFYVGTDGMLQREDPRQTALDLREAEVVVQPLRDVSVLREPVRISAPPRIVTPDKE